MEGPLRDRTFGDTTGVRLIETLLWDGAAYPRLALHLARLAQGAARLGFVCHLSAVRAALAAARGPSPLRVRLTLGAEGEVEVTTAHLFRGGGGPLGDGQQGRAGLCGPRTAGGAVGIGEACRHWQRASRQLSGFPANYHPDPKLRCSLYERHRALKTRSRCSGS